MATVELDTLPPQNLEAEESVLGAMLVANQTIEPVVSGIGLKPADFYRDRHAKIFEAISSLHNRSDAVDHVTVSEALMANGVLDEIGGKDTISNLAATVPAAGNAVHHAKIVKQNALLRRLIEAADTIRERVYARESEAEHLADQAQQLMYEVGDADRKKDFRSVADILDDEVSRLELLSKGDQELTGTPSGFRDLDGITGGFQPGNLVVVAARPSMGKSALVANIAEHVAVTHGRAVAFFSLEMSESELAQRFIACRARLPGEKLRRGRVTEREWPKVLKAANEFHEAPLFIDESSDIDLLEIRGKSRRLAHQNGGLGCVIVDYLQLMRADFPNQSRVEIVSALSRGLKILARELEVPVIAISQLSRAPEQRVHDKRPILSDLRESGQIEQDADLVMFLYRHEYYEPEDAEQNDQKGIAEVIVAKHRNGPIGTRELVFLSDYPRFADKARESRGESRDAGAGGAGEPSPEPAADEVF